MRIKIAVFSIFLFTLLALSAYAILQPSEVSTGAGESLADKLMESSQSGVILKQTDAGVGGFPIMSRSQQENYSVVWTPMPETLISGKNPKATRAQSQGQSTESATALMPDATVADSSVGTQNPTSLSANLAGTWSLNLNDISSKQAALTLFQVEDRIFGSGSMKNESYILMVAASGSVKDHQIYLDITSVGTISLYSLVMTSSGDRSDSVSGDYKAYTTDGKTWVGKVQGSRISATS